MNHAKHERIEVIRQAYKGLFQLVSRALFDKYADFIDVYSQISEQEQQQLIDPDVDLVKQILANEPVEIPLHLLADGWTFGGRPG